MNFLPRERRAARAQARARAAPPVERGADDRRAAEAHRGVVRRPPAAGLVRRTRFGARRRRRGAGGRHAATGRAARRRHRRRAVNCRSGSDRWLPGGLARRPGAHRRGGAGRVRPSGVVGGQVRGYHAPVHHRSGTGDDPSSDRRARRSRHPHRCRHRPKPERGALVVRPARREERGRLDLRSPGPRSRTSKRCAPADRSPVLPTPSHRRPELPLGCCW